MAKHRVHDGDGRQWGGPALTSGATFGPNRHVAPDADDTTPLPVVRVGGDPGPDSGWFTAPVTSEGGAIRAWDVTVD